VDLKTFQNNISKIEEALSNDLGSRFIWIDPSWVEIKPINEKDSTISIRFLFDEVRVGIDLVTISFSDSYSTGMMFADGYKKFLTLLTSPIKRISKSKGKYSHRIEYFFENDERFESFGTFLTWNLFFWRRTIISEHIQSSSLDRKSVTGINIL
jgi:hypothetical protein